MGDAIQQSVKNKTSKYIGVCWNKNGKKWEATLNYNKKQCYGGLFDNEEHAAMKVNLLCDEYETERKNPTIDIDTDAMQQLYEKTKSKMACVHHFIQSNDEESCIDRASCQNQKRK